MITAIFAGLVGTASAAFRTTGSQPSTGTIQVTDDPQLQAMRALKYKVAAAAPQGPPPPSSSNTLEYFHYVDPQALGLGLPLRRYDKVRLRNPIAVCGGVWIVWGYSTEQMNYLLRRNADSLDPRDDSQKPITVPYAAIDPQHTIKGERWNEQPKSVPAHKPKKKHRDFKGKDWAVKRRQAREQKAQKYKKDKKKQEADKRARKRGPTFVIKRGNLLLEHLERAARTELIPSPETGSAVQGNVSSENFPKEFLDTMWKENQLVPINMDDKYPNGQSAKLLGTVLGYHEKTHNYLIEVRIKNYQTFRIIIPPQRVALGLQSRGHYMMAGQSNNMAMMRIFMENLRDVYKLDQSYYFSDYYLKRKREFETSKLQEYLNAAARNGESASGSKLGLELTNDAREYYKAFNKYDNGQVVPFYVNWQNKKITFLGKILGYNDSTKQYLISCHMKRENDDNHFKFKVENTHVGIMRRDDTYFFALTNVQREVRREIIEHLKKSMIDQSEYLDERRRLSAAELEVRRRRMKERLIQYHA